jgi:hypothetical protein
MTDPYEFDDGAYVLNSLAPHERAAFEEHMSGCAACTARVREVQDVPWLLVDITTEDVASATPLPDTVLPGMLRRAREQRRRRRWLVGGLTSIAAACVIALVVMLRPSSSTPDRPPAPVAARQFVALGKSPVQASAVLTAKAWGTAIDLECRYVPGTVDRTFEYQMLVYDRSGHKHAGGDWRLPTESDIDFPTGTAVPLTQIARIDIALPNGTPILRLSL